MRSATLKPGEQYGQLTMLRPSSGHSSGKRKYEFLCKCGKIFVAIGKDVKRGHTKSCGCLKIKTLIERSTTHGKTHNPTYVSWHNMKARTSNPKASHYSYYGGRGIKLCERWQKFENFLADMGERPEGTSLDRINVEGNYEPGNCRWATWEQQANNSRKNTYIKFNGEEKTIAEWARETGLSEKLIAKRKYNGWEDEEILKTPPRPKHWKGLPRRLNMVTSIFQKT